MIGIVAEVCICIGLYLYYRRWKRRRVVSPKDGAARRPPKAHDLV